MKRLVWILLCLSGLALAQTQHVAGMLDLSNPWSGLNTFNGGMLITTPLTMTNPFLSNPPAQPFIGIDCDQFSAYQTPGAGQLSCDLNGNLIWNPDGLSQVKALMVDTNGVAADGQYYSYSAVKGKFVLTPGTTSSVSVPLNPGCVDVRGYFVIPNNPEPEKEDFGAALNRALNAVIAASSPLGTFCVDTSAVVPSANGQALYGNRLFANTSPWKGIGSNKNPDIRWGNSTISTSVQWDTPQGAMLMQGVPAAGTVNTGGNFGMAGSILSACNDTGGCGPNAYPQYTTAAGCLTGSTNCYPVGGPWLSGANALPAVFNTGQVQVQSNANTAQCGSPANSGQSNKILCGASGAPTFTAAMVGGIIAYNCTANTCTAGSTAAYSLSRIVQFLGNGASFPLGGGTCTPVSGTGCLLTDGIVQGGTNLTAAFLLYSPNLPVILCDGCLGNAINNFTFGHVWRDFAFDVNGVSGGLGYLGPSVQERTEFTDVNVTLQGQQTTNNAAASGCMAFGGGITTSVVATHWNTAGVIGCSTNTNATSNVSGGTYGEVVEGFNIIKGTVNGCPNVHNFGTIVGQAASKFWDSAWVDGCTLTSGVFFGPHTEFYSNDTIEVGQLHPVTGVIFIGTSAASNAGANAVIEFDAGTASNVTLSTQCGASGVPIIKDDTLVTTTAVPCGTTTATQTLTRYFQPGGNGGNSFPVSYAVTPFKLTGLNADQALTTIYTTNATGAMGGAGTYRVCFSAYTTTSGSGTTSTVQVQSNNANGGSQVFTSATWALNSLTTTGQVNGCQIVHQGVSAPLKVGTTSGTYGTSFYAIEGTVEQLQGTP